MSVSKTKHTVAERYSFLSGGGEMGELMRAKDWSKTPLGNPDNWPQSLRTTLSIILNSRFPMFLFWGPQFVCFYNDAYRPSLGKEGKHPHILGERGEDWWLEIWPVIKPLMDQVLSGGEATWSEDQLLPIYRNGKIEDTYWTFSHSPVNDETGKPAGVFVTCVETTENVNNKKNIEESERNLRLMILLAPVAIGILRGTDYKVEIANKRTLELWGRNEEEVIGKPLLEAMPELQDQGIKKLLDDVYKTGNRFAATELPVELLRKRKIETKYINFSYEALYNSDGNINGIMAIGFEVTDQVLTRQKVEEAEERIRLATEAAELATWDLDLQTGKIIHSPRLAEIFGHKKSKKLSHLQMRSQIDAGDRVLIIEKEFEKALKTGLYFYEARIIKPDENSCWIRTQGKVFYNEDKLAVKIIGTLRDITQEKIYRQELEEREKKFRILADFMPQFVWTADAEGILNYFNQAVYDYSGLSAAKIKSEGWLQIVHDNEREENKKAWVEAIKKGTDFIFEHRFKRADGVYRWQLSRAIPLRDANGIIQMWVGTSTDIHNMKEQDEQKDYFISMASHELKTPITSIKGYVQILKTMYAGKEDSFLINSLNIVDKQIVTLTNLISDLLDVSKIKTGGLIFKKEYFEITKLINEISDEIKNINPAYKIDVSAEKEIWINADRDRIGQVLINLLTNAIKYAPQSNAIKIMSAERENRVIVSVKDKGIGISKKDQERIFERFYRVEGKNENTFPGFGIGLFISSQIIHRHHGTISVESQPGEGAVFTFLLPIN